MIKLHQLLGALILFALQCLPALANPPALSSLSEGSFAQTRFLPGVPLPLNSSGSFEYTDQRVLIWRTELPVQSTLTVSEADGVVDESGQAINGSKVVAGLLLDIIAGNSEALAELFDLAWRVEEGKTHLDLTPTQPAIANLYKLISVSGSTVVERIELHELNEGRVLITLSAASAGD